MTNNKLQSLISSLRPLSINKCNIEEWTITGSKFQFNHPKTLRCSRVKTLRESLPFISVLQDLKD